MKIFIIFDKKKKISTNLLITQKSQIENLHSPIVSLMEKIMRRNNCPTHDQTSAKGQHKTTTFGCDKSQQERES
jgi:hypothetical protein